MSDNVKLINPEFTEEISYFKIKDNIDLDSVLKQQAKECKYKKDIENANKIVQKNNLTSVNTKYDKIINTFEFFEDD